jgi:Striatin family
MTPIPQARIALLEGERRSFENIKIDLLRRVKMMEYALRVERYVRLHLAVVGFSLTFSAMLLALARSNYSNLEQTRRLGKLLL